MPHAGVSTEFVQRCEDDAATFILAGEQLDGLRTLAQVLRQRQMITDTYYQDMHDALDYIGGALLLGKRNTARLRRAGV